MIVLKYGAVKGNCEIAGYEGWIVCGSYQFGVGRGIASAADGNKRTATAPSISEITLTKQTDPASADLYFAALCGSGVDASVHFLNTQDNKVEVFLKFEMKNAMISGYSMSSGGDLPSESLSINFVEITYQFDQYDGASVKTGDVKKWDLAKAKSA